MQGPSECRLRGQFEKNSPTKHENQWKLLGDIKQKRKNAQKAKKCQERHTPVWKGQTVLKHVRLSKTEIIEMY